jgi:hypothetical protein
MPPRSDGRGPLARLFRSRRAERSSAAQADHGWIVDRAVSALTAACGGEGRPVPAVHALVIGTDTVWFRLSTPDERPPAGWTVDDQGRTWHTPLAWLQNTNLPEPLDEPYPRLVGFGHTSQGFMLLNLGQAGGIIGLEGDLRQAGSLAQKWTDELTTNPWSRGVPVIRVGFTPETPEPAGTMEAATLADAAPPLADERGGVLLLASPPDESESERVRTLAAGPMGRWSVVVVGRVEDPLWRFTVDSTGVVESALLDEPVLRRPAAPPPARDDDTAVVAGGYPVDGGGQRPPLVTRTRVIVASVCAACLLVAAGILVSPTIIHASAQDTPQSAPPSPSHSPLSKPSPTSASPTPSPSMKPSPTAAPTTAAPPSKHPSKAPATTGIPAGGTGEIRGVASGMCVDSDTNPAVSLNGQPSGGHAFTNPCTQSPTEQWQEGPLLSNDSPRGANLYRLVDHQTGFCLDSDGNGGIYALPCLNPDQYQVWQRVSNGTTVAYRDQVTNRCLAVSTSDGTLQTQPCPTNGYPNKMLFSRPR